MSKVKEDSDGNNFSNGSPGTEACGMPAERLGSHMHTAGASASQCCPVADAYDLQVMSPTHTGVGSATADHYLYDGLCNWGKSEVPPHCTGILDPLYIGMRSRGKSEAPPLHAGIYTGPRC